MSHEARQTQSRRASQGPRQTQGARASQARRQNAGPPSEPNQQTGDHMALKPPKTADLVACSDLVLDFTIYPRSSVDATTVSQYVLALQAGEQFPPIIVDRKTKRVVDGFHRVKAYIIAHGDETKIPGIWGDFKDETEM